MLKQLSQLGEKLTDELQKSLGDASQTQGQDPHDSTASTQPDSGNNSNSNAPLSTSNGDIDAKLRRLQKFESKYPLLLQAYKTLKQQQAKLVGVIMEHTALKTSLNKDGKDTGVIDAEELVEYFKENEARLESLDSEVKKLKEEVAVKQSKINELEQQQEQQPSGDIITTSKATDDDEIETLRDMLRDVGNELVTAKDRIKELETSKTTDSDNLRVTLQQRDKTISYLEAQVKQYSQTQQSDQKGLESAKAENSLLKKRMDAMQENTRQLTAKCEEYLRENGKLSERLETLRHEYERLEQKETSSNSEIDAMKRQYEEMNLKLKEANAKIISLEDELGDYTTTIRERSSELESLRHLLTNVRNEDATNQRNLETKLAMAAEERNKLESQLALQSSRSTIELQNLKMQNTELKMELDGSKARETKLLEELKTMREQNVNEAVKHGNAREYDTNNNNNSNNSNNSDEKIDKIQKNLKELLARSDKRRRELQDTNDELMSLNNELNKKLDRLTRNYRLLSGKLNSMKTNNISSGSNNGLTASADSSVSPSVSQTNIGGDHMGADGTEKIAYVRNVLLGFLEHKEQRRHLLPVVSTLLQLDSNDEQRFLSALDMKS